MNVCMTTFTVVDQEEVVNGNKIWSRICLISFVRYHKPSGMERRSVIAGWRRRVCSYLGNATGLSGCCRACNAPTWCSFVVRARKSVLAVQETEFISYFGVQNAWRNRSRCHSLWRTLTRARHCSESQLSILIFSSIRSAPFICAPSK